MAAIFSDNRMGIPEGETRTSLAPNELRPLTPDAITVGSR